jgi:type IV secretory pathway VirJ component
MNIQSLKDVLASLSDALEAAKAKNASSEIKEIASLFPEGSETSALDAITAIEGRLENEKAEARDSYANRLKAAGTSKDAFSKVLAELNADKVMDRDDISSIAEAYIGAGKRWRSRRAVLQSIQEKFSERVYLESKMRLLG